jgi:hypothetical protein
MMFAARIVGILSFAFALGCAGVKEAPPGVVAQPGPLVVEPSLVVTNQDAAVAARPSRSEPKEQAAVTPAQPAPRAKAPAQISASPPAIERPRKKEDPPPVAKRLESPLDVAALKARLRDTSAIGIFTKLALKNQVDDLLQRFRAHYGSGQKTSVAALRQPYDMLVLKVLALLQDSDPSLARTISGSREAIWGILADPDKFNAVT